MEELREKIARMWGMPLVISPAMNPGQFALVTESHAIVFCGLDLASGKDYTVEAVRGRDGRWRVLP